MKFKTVNKNIFTYTNKNGDFIAHHKIENISLFKEYTILFNGMSEKNLSSINIKLFKENDECEEVLLNINKSYKFRNKNIDKVEIDINLKEDTIFTLKVLEEPILFNENTYEVSNMVKEFMDKIDSDLYDKTVIIPTFNVKIACILDEFSYDCFSYDCNLLQLKSMTWEKQIKDFHPDLLLVESAWYGICKTWIKKVACEEDLDETLYSLINYCKDNSIPTVFFNKEGLVNFSYFEKSSSVFDYIFVSDENIIPYQIKACNHNNIYPLSFAAQPKIHNSINKNKYKLGEIAFAGGWYNDIHKDRFNDFEYMVKPALKYGLHIYDRNFHQREMLEFIEKYWPQEYLDNIVGKLDYKYMVEAYKNYNVFLNVNSVQNSSYMVSRRVYEILACKTLLLTSYSKCISDNFSDYVLISKNKDNTMDYLDKILSNPSLYEKQSKKSQRYILENHTYKNRFMEIFNILNINYNKPIPTNIGLICIIEDISHIENIAEIILNQEYTPTYTYLIINRNININSCIDLLDINNLYYNFYSEEKDICHIINYIHSLEHNVSHYALFYSKNYYGPNYLRDYVNILSYTNASIIGKCQVYEIDYNHFEIAICSYKDSYVKKVYKDTLFCHKDCLLYLTLYNDNFSCDYVCSSDLVIYSDDEYNFIRNIVDDRNNRSKYIDFISI